MGFKSKKDLDDFLGAVPKSVKEVSISFDDLATISEFQRWGFNLHGRSIVHIDDEETGRAVIGKYSTPEEVRKCLIIATEFCWRHRDEIKEGPQDDVPLPSQTDDDMR